MKQEKVFCQQFFFEVDFRLLNLYYSVTCLLPAANGNYNCSCSNYFVSIRQNMVYFL